MVEPHDNPYESPRDGGALPQESVGRRVSGFEIIVAFTAMGGVAGWLLLPERFGPFQYPMGRPDVAVGGLAGLFFGVVFAVRRRFIDWRTGNSSVRVGS
jgi:hypothetical protein